MKWFIAKLVFRVTCGSGTHPAQFNEQLRLVYAEDELHGFHKARLMGEGDKLQNQEPMPAVQWKFIDVVELHCLQPGVDGSEIFSVMREEADAKTYIRSVQRGAQFLLQHGLQQFIH
ncbi:MAG: DUF4288 domain-containing protein [Chitinophagaceae bacterium]|nr:MAG: DUF4288 domain-containing protein [Chitinophagaceae bacterium]